MCCYSLRLFYNHGECVVLRTQSGDSEEVGEIISRLLTVTPGAEVRQQTLVTVLSQQALLTALGLHSGE